VGNVHAYILGEHGDSELPAWSLTHVAGIPIDEYGPKYGSGDWSAERERIVREVKESAYHIINYKGATYYAIGMALVRIVGAILQDQDSVLTVSTLLDGEYGIRDVCLGIPCVVGQRGVMKIVEAALSKEEEKALQRSAATLREALKNLQATQ
jgi:L-lactate dehydrogenase